MRRITVSLLLIASVTCNQGCEIECDPGENACILLGFSVVVNCKGFKGCYKTCPAGTESIQYFNQPTSPLKYPPVLTMMEKGTSNTKHTININLCDFFK